MRERLLWPWNTKPSAGKLTCPKHVIFMSKCLEVLTAGWSMPGECLPRCGLGAALLAARWVWPWEAKKEKFHTCGGPRRRPCLGQGRGRRISYISIIYFISIYYNEIDNISEYIMMIMKLDELPLTNDLSEDFREAASGTAAVQPNQQGELQA